MKFRRDSTKGEMMDEGTLEQKMSRAWLEGLEAAFDVDSPVNPYEPVEYTPNDQEITETLLGTFTGDEIGRYSLQYRLNIAALERVRVMGELENLEQRLTHTAPAAYTVGTCIRIIREMKV
jgi:hypothetical protein